MHCVALLDSAIDIGVGLFFTKGLLYEALDTDSTVCCAGNIVEYCCYWSLIVGV